MRRSRSLIFSLLTVAALGPQALPSAQAGWLTMCCRKSCDQHCCHRCCDRAERRDFLADAPRAALVTSVPAVMVAQQAVAVQFVPGPDRQSAESDSECADLESRLGRLEDDLDELTGLVKELTLSVKALEIRTRPDPATDRQDREAPPKSETKPRS